jgi:hypothetical protein
MLTWPVPSPMPVGEGRQGRIRPVRDDLDRALGGDRRHEPAGLLDDRADQDRLERHAQVTGFDPGDVDELVDEREQVPSGAEDPLDAVAVFLAELG